MKNLVLSFSEFIKNSINEGIRTRMDGEGWVFDFSTDQKNDIMSLRFLNRQSRTMTYRNTDVQYEYFYCYKLQKEEDSSDLVKAIKYMDDALIDPTDLERFVKKGVIALNDRHDLSEFDCILYPKSTSNILTKFAEFAAQKSGVARLIPDAFVKTATKDITLDFNAFNRLKDERTKKEIIKNLERAQRDPNGDWKTTPFKMTDVYVKFRKFITNFLQFGSSVKRENDLKRDFVNIVTAGNVLIIDDFRTTGSTIKEMLKNVVTLGPKKIVICCLIIIEKYKEEDERREQERIEIETIERSGIPYVTVLRDGKHVRMVDRSRIDRKYTAYVYDRDLGDWVPNPDYVGEFEHQQKVEDKLGNIIDNPFYDPTYKRTDESFHFFT